MTLWRRIPSCRRPRPAGGVVYALYILGLFHGLTLIIGLIMAYVVRGSAGPANASHYTYLIRTFWISLIWMVIGGGILLVGIPLSLILIGIPLVWLGGTVCFLAWLWASDPLHHWRKSGWPRASRSPGPTASRSRPIPAGGAPSWRSRRPG